MNDFHYVIVLLDLLYGLDMEEEDVEELGLIAWNLIGNKRIRLYKYCAPIDCKDNSVLLPCNVMENGVEAVTINPEDWKSTTNYSDLGDFNSAFVEQYNEGLKWNNSPFYISGKLVKYQQVGDKLYFPHNYGTVNILYKGIEMGEDELPQLSDKEATAIATYIAYTQKFKEGLITNSAPMTQQAMALKAMWLQQCDQARITYLNQNDMNNILEVKNSFDRSWYGKSFKPLK